MFWKLIARLVSMPCVADYLIRRAKKTPYQHIYHGDELYMGRWWLFNPYPWPEEDRNTSWLNKLIPFNIRIHHIAQPDTARDMHDHPWNARTFILKGGYIEHKQDGRHYRVVGDTARIKFGEFHNILKVKPNTYTMFISGKYRGTWGFLVNGTKVQWRKYKGYEDQQ